MLLIKQILMRPREDALLDLSLSHLLNPHPSAINILLDHLVKNKTYLGKLKLSNFNLCPSSSSTNGLEDTFSLLNQYILKINRYQEAQSPDAENDQILTHLDLSYLNLSQ